MPNITRVAASLLLLFFSCTAFAQSNYKKGFLVTTSGDTLSGEIDYQEWSKNPREVFFKSTGEAATRQKHGPGTIRSFQVPGFAAYEGFTVSVSMDPVGMSELKTERDTSKVTDTVFLHVLQQGDKLTLYSYKDGLKTRFYLLEKGTRIPLELAYSQYRNGSQLVVLPTYRVQLLKTATRQGALTPALERDIHAAAYTKAALLKISTQINGLKSAGAGQQEVSGAKSRLFVGAGGNLNRVTYKGESPVTYDKLGSSSMPTYKSQVLTTALSPKVSAGMDIFANPAVQKLILRGEVSATLVKSNITTTHQFLYPEEEVDFTYSLSGLQVAFSPQLIYNLYNRERCKFFVGAGVSLGAMRLSQNEMHRQPKRPDSRYEETRTANYFQLKNMYLSGLFRTGVLLNNRLELSASFQNPVELTNYATAKGASVRMGSTQVGLAVMFNRAR
jgi:hypothetical protein